MSVRSALKRRMAAWFLRRQGLDRFPVTLRRRRLYILPTRAGLGFSLVLLGMLVAALNYGNSMALLLTCLLGGFVLVAMHQCHRNLNELKLTAVIANPAFAGERGTLTLRLGNDSALARFRIEIDTSGIAAAVTDLPPQCTRHVDLRVPTARRGLVRLDRLRLSTTHPFGLFRAWSWVHAPLTLIVYPRPRGARPVPPQPGGQEGRTREPAAQRDEWLGLRPFREGDSPRQVAWKAYARGAPLLAKEYSASGSEQHIFDFDRIAGLETEDRLEQLARWIVDAEARGERYGLVLRGLRLLPQHGPDHRRRALTALALHGMDAP
ncbi:MAG TPA: DUF58 domain-containing protein [Steroidobacteraceae bacterium]|nr:DUF58 domain-containing protein [Steroidobacteraceae bacterium]